MLNRQHSPLLRLPAELRNQIYEYVFPGQVVHVQCERRTQYADCFHCLRLDYDLDTITLTKTMQVIHTCRQSRAEFEPLFFQQNPFLYQQQQDR